MCDFHDHAPTSQPLRGDEWVLDTPTVRAFIADVRDADRRGRLAGRRLRRDRAALPRRCSPTRRGCPDAYRESAPESGMGGGIGQWLLYRAGRPVALPVQPRRAGRLDDADPRPPRVGPDRPLPRRPGRGDLPARRRRAGDSSGSARSRVGDCYRLLPPRERRPPRPHDLGGHVGLDPPARERHRLRPRHTYDEQTGEARPFRSGYVNAACEGGPLVAAEDRAG